MKIDKFEYKNTKDAILLAIDDLSDDGDISTGCFTEGFYKRDFKDIQNQIKILEKELKTRNIDLFGFIKKYEEKVFNDSDFTGKNAFLDTVLYSYDKNKSLLGGNKMSDGEEEEYFIKYKYGYYNYDMGKKYILQTYDTMEDYYEDTAKNIIYSYFDANFGCRYDDCKKLYNRSSTVKKVNNGYQVFAELRSLSVISDYDDKYDRFVEDVGSDFSDIPYYQISNILVIFIGCEETSIPKSEFEKIQQDLENKYFKLEDEISLTRSMKKYNV